MAIYASRIGSGRKTQPDPVDQPEQAATIVEPVARMPAGGVMVRGAITRIQTTRVIGAGWKGVGLRLRNGESEQSLFEVFLTAGDGRDLVVALCDEDEAVAVWRGVGRSTLLPMLLQTLDGKLVEPYPQIGAVALGRHRYRRQHSFLRGRRPRFLTRRKPGPKAALPAGAGREPGDREI